MEISRIWNKKEEVQTLYNEWSEEVNKIVERNMSIPKKDNKRKMTKLLLKAKKEIKKKRKHGDADTKLLKQREHLLSEYIIQEDRKQHSQKIEKIVNKLKETKGINGPNFWEVIRQIKRKDKESPYAVQDKNGNLLEEKELILQRYREFYTELLQMKPAIGENQKNQEIFINQCMENVLMVANNSSMEKISKSQVEEGLKKLKKRKCKDAEGWRNEILICGGEEMTKSLEIMFNKIEEIRKPPEQWDKMIIASINKKNPKTIMENKRGIFLTNIVSKVYERILITRNKKRIDESMSPYRSGGRKGRSTSDNIIMINTIIQKHKKIGKKTYIFFGDAVKCFDKLWLKDGLIELYKAGVPACDVQMLHVLNKKA